jgi:hypothetical protein
VEVAAYDVTAAAIEMPVARYLGVVTSSGSVTYGP